jgi:hypothetical protein
MKILNIVKKNPNIHDIRFAFVRYPIIKGGWVEIPLTNVTCHICVLITSKDMDFQCHMQGFQSGPVPGTFTRLRSCIVPAEITEPPKISGGQNHKYDWIVEYFSEKINDHVNC